MLITCTTTICVEEKSIFAWSVLHVRCFILVSVGFTIVLFAGLRKHTPQETFQCMSETGLPKEYVQLRHARDSSRLLRPIKIAHSSELSTGFTRPLAVKLSLRTTPGLCTKFSTMLFSRSKRYALYFGQNFPCPFPVPLAVTCFFEGSEHDCLHSGKHGPDTVKEKNTTKTWLNKERHFNNNVHVCNAALNLCSCITRALWVRPTHAHSFSRRVWENLGGNARFPPTTILGAVE